MEIKTLLRNIIGRNNYVLSGTKINNLVTVKYHEFSTVRGFITQRHVDDRITVLFIDAIYRKIIK